jgi:hypothetical protein
VVVARLVIYQIPVVQELMAQQILVAVVAVQDFQIQAQLPLAQAVQASLSFATQAHLTPQQAQQVHRLSPHRVGLEFISSQLLAQLRFNS